ncbi:MAG: hypothetical protein CM1200mP40_29400 [Gammaproteobacteria bacterium]|nr:MAG: hypothetical protein CM1200mP40_29400 [Gammaproteobacteria bacterium]
MHWAFLIVQTHDFAEINDSMNLLNKIFGSSNTRKLKKMNRAVAIINNMEASFEALSNDELKEKTVEFKNRVEAGEALEAILPEAFAAVREASKRTLGLRHFDVQMIGGMVLHKGQYFRNADR